MLDWFEFCENPKLKPIQPLLSTFQVLKPK